jgi:hypothetical protein
MTKPNNQPNKKHKSMFGLVMFNFILDLVIYAKNHAPQRGGIKSGAVLS